MTREPNPHLRSLWWSELDEGERTHRRPALTDDASVDVAIIGAGYTGLWTAYYLQALDPTLRIAILDQSVAGSGASGRNGGWCSSLLPLGWNTIAKHHGRDATVRWQRAADATIGEIERVITAESIDCDFRRGGYLRTASNVAHLQLLHGEIDEARSWGRTEEQLRFLSPTEASTVINATPALGATFSPNFASIQPARLARGLADVVEVRGASIYEDTTVTSISPRRVATSARYTVEAQVVVRATEGFTPNLAGAHRDVLPMYSSMIATEPLDSSVREGLRWCNGETFSDPSRNLFYAQLTKDGRIAFGGRGAPYRFGSRFEDPVRNIEEVADGLKARLVEQFPQLADVAITHSWGGVLGVPRDWMPQVRFDRLSGIGIAGGYSGDGVALTNLAGRTLADLICGEQSDLVDLPWVDHRSRQWEPEPLRWMGVTAASALATATDHAESSGASTSGVLSRAFSKLSGH